MKKMTANGTTVTITSREDVKNWLNEYRFKENHASTLVSCIEYTTNILKEAEELLASDPDAVDPKNIKALEAHNVKLKELLEKCTTELATRCARVTLLVESIPSPEVRHIITEHYYNNKLLKIIALDMGISLSKAKYLHRTGLDYLADKM